MESPPRFWLNHDSQFSSHEVLAIDNYAQWSPRVTLCRLGRSPHGRALESPYLRVASRPLGTLAALELVFEIERQSLISFEKREE